MVFVTSSAIPLAVVSLINGLDNPNVCEFPHPDKQIDFTAMPLPQLQRFDKLARTVKAATLPKTKANNLACAFERACRLELVRRYRVEQAEQNALPSLLRRQAN